MAPFHKFLLKLSKIISPLELRYSAKCVCVCKFITRRKGDLEIKERLVRLIENLA